MKVLVIGQGGREHAMCWKLAQSERVSRVYCAPGNPGIKSVAELVPLAVDQIDELVEWAKSEVIDLVVVGPEYPLTLGIVDQMAAAGIRVFGPSSAAAQLEGSKSFAKAVMDAAGVASAGYKVFDDFQELESYAHKRGAPLVLKADGLAAGKGVFVCLKESELGAALVSLKENLKAKRVVVEDYLSGLEASFIVATNGKVIVPLAASHDYKRIRDNDEGPNTGGMGAVSPTPHLTAEQEKEVLDRVMRPVIEQMEREGAPFLGFLYGGLMIEPSGEIKVIEFNVRLGDPESQAVLRRMEGDLFELLYTLSDSNAEVVAEQKWSDKAAVCVVLASAGYPESSSKGDVIEGIERAQRESGVVVFHAGTGQNEDSKLVTAGGRVLNVTALGDDIVEARERAYRGVEQISFTGRQYRRDIAGASAPGSRKNS